MLQILLTIIIIVSAFPLGYLLAYLCRDELVQGRRWFVLLVLISLLLALVMAFLNFEVKFAVILTLFFIVIVSFISVYLSYNKKFLGKYA